MNPAQGHDVILFDGVCGLCNGLVRFVLARDPTDRFRFASLQSAFATTALKKHGIVATALDTVYVLTNYATPSEGVLSKSQAAFHVLRFLRSPWKVFLLFKILPHYFLDFGYDLVARFRYRVFGRYGSCPLPTPEMQTKFI